MIKNRHVKQGTAVALLALALIIAAAVPACGGATPSVTTTTSSPGTTTTTTSPATTAATTTSPTTTIVATTTTVTTTPAPSGGPSLTMVQPEMNSYVVGTDTIKVVVQVAGFELVDGSGRANAAGQGHINYFFNVKAPAAPGQPATTAPGTYASSTATTYSWPGLSDGVYTVAAELVNNDDTPLSPPVVAEASVSLFQG